METGPHERAPADETPPAGFALPGPIAITRKRPGRAFPPLFLSRFADRAGAARFPSRRDAPAGAG